jgi:hypothetical protein
MASFENVNIYCASFCTCIVIVLLIEINNYHQLLHRERQESNKWLKDSNKWFWKYVEKEEEQLAEQKLVFPVHLKLVYFMDKILVEALSVNDGGDTTFRTLKCPDPENNGNALASILCAKKELSNQFMNTKSTAEIYRLCEITTLYADLCTYMNYLPFLCTSERLKLLDKCNFTENNTSKSLFDKTHKELSACLIENAEPYKECIKSFLGFLPTYKIYVED